MTTLTLTRQPAAGVTSDERHVIFASSLGTVFEWYDFYLYATLAPFFAALFFPPGNDTAALLSAFADYVYSGIDHAAEVFSLTAGLYTLGIGYYWFWARGRLQSAAPEELAARQARPAREEEVR